MNDEHSIHGFFIDQFILMRYLLAPLRFPDWILDQWSQITHYKISFTVLTSACCYRKITAVMKKETNMINCLFYLPTTYIRISIKVSLGGANH